MLPRFVTNAINNALNKIFPSASAVVPRIPAPYANAYEASVGLMQTHSEEFNAIARKHNVQGHGIIFNRKTGEPEYHVMLVKGDETDISDIPKAFKDGLPIVVEYRGIATRGM